MSRFAKWVRWLIQLFGWELLVVLVGLVFVLVVDRAFLEREGDPAGVLIPMLALIILTAFILPIVMVVRERNRKRNMPQNGEQESGQRNGDRN